MASQGSFVPVTASTVIYPTRDELDSILDLLALSINHYQLDEYGPSSPYRVTIDMMKGSGLLSDLADQLDRIMGALADAPSMIEHAEHDLISQEERKYGMPWNQHQVIEGSLDKLARVVREKKDEHMKTGGVEEFKEHKHYLAEANTEARQLRKERDDLKKSMSLIKQRRDEMKHTNPDQYNDLAYDYNRVRSAFEEIVDRLSELEDVRAEHSEWIDRFKDNEDAFDGEMADLKKKKKSLQADLVTAKKVHKAIKHGGFAKVARDTVFKALDEEWRGAMEGLTKALRISPYIAEEITTQVLRLSEATSPTEKRAIEGKLRGIKNRVIYMLEARYQGSGLRSVIDQAADSQMIRDIIHHNESQAWVHSYPATQPENSKQEKIDELIQRGIAMVDRFAAIDLFQVKTPIGFTAEKIVLQRRVPDPKRLIMPRQGRFSFHLKADDAARIFDRYIQRMEPIDPPMQARMIAALEELRALLNEAGDSIAYISGAHIVEMTTSQVYHFSLAMTKEAFLQDLNIAIENITSDEPSLDNYIRMFDEQVSGSDPASTTTDTRCRYANPFDLTPTYLFFGIAGGAHKAIDKTYYWLHLVNSGCNDMECIPSALRIRRADLASVSDEEIVAVEKQLTKINADQMFDTSIYRLLLASVKQPWVIVGSVTAVGTWKIIACSSSELFDLTPEQFALRLRSVIGLHVRGGHMTRITAIIDYDESGWKYKMDNFAVIASIGSDSGVGPPLVKLLRGHKKIADEGACCLGNRAYSALLASKLSIADSILSMLTTRAFVPLLVDDALEAAELREEEGQCNVTLGPGVIDGRDYPDGVPLSALHYEECVALALAEYDKRSQGERVYDVWTMLGLPHWIVVKDLDKESQSWTVASASEPELLSITPLEAVQAASSLIVLLKNTRSQTIRRIVDYFISMPQEDGSTTICSARYNLAVMSSSIGIEGILRQLALVDIATNEPLISDDEIEVVKEAKTAEEIVCCFKRARCVVMTNVKMTKAGRVKSYAFTSSPAKKIEMVELNNGEKAKVGGPITASDIANGASDLIRLWQDPDGLLWGVIAEKFYNATEVMKKLEDALPTVYIAADYETVNRGDDTLPVLLAYAIFDGTKPVNDVEAECFTGTDCTRSFINMLEALSINRRCKVIVVTFHGAFFDMHMMLEGVATYGGFGENHRDRVILVGNKLLEIDWKSTIRFIDMRRFTSSSLEMVCKELVVKTPKSKINLELVQRIYEEAQYGLQPFWVRLRKMQASELIVGITEDATWPAFTQRLTGLNAEQAYIEYCKNDTTATLQCWMRIREGCLKIPAITGCTDKQRIALYEPSNYCTLPAMAYKLYRATLPVDDNGSVIFPPTASSYEMHSFIVGSLLGGRSEIYSTTYESSILGTLIEEHSILDVTSLFPFCAMAGHMPTGSIHPVTSDLSNFPGWLGSPEVRKLPVPNKLGIYRCRIMKQPPGYCVIPERRKGKPLNWIAEAPFEAIVNVVLLRLHLFLGGEAIVEYGLYTDGMCDSYFDESLWRWRDVKMLEDTLASDSRAKDKAAACLARLSAKEVEIGRPLEKYESDALRSDYEPNIRYMVKQLSNSLLGKMAKKLKEAMQQVVYGDSTMARYQEEHKGENYCVHQLAKTPIHTVEEQIVAPYSKASLITSNIDPATLFTRHIEGKSSIPEALISSTMLAYSHFHMALASRRMVLAKAARGIETDGLHNNPDLYARWAERALIPNPYWIDSVLRDVASGSILDDDVFKPTMGSARSEKYMAVLGSFYCPYNAKRYAEMHGLPTDMIKPIDYGYFKEELPIHCQFRVCYPFCKFYYFEPADASAQYPETATSMKAKGVGKDTRDGETVIKLQLSHAYDDLFRMSAVIGGSKGKESRLMDRGREISAAYSASPKILRPALYTQLSAGVGVDVADYRFQGRLSKLNACTVHYMGVDKASSKLFETPLHHSFATKRIEPPHPMHLATDFTVGGQLLGQLDQLQLQAQVRTLFGPPTSKTAWIDALYKQRGFSYQSAIGPVYVPNRVLRSIFQSSKPNTHGATSDTAIVREAREEASATPGQAIFSNASSELRGDRGV